MPPKEAIFVRPITKVLKEKDVTLLYIIKWLNRIRLINRWKMRMYHPLHSLHNLILKIINYDKRNKEF